MRWDALAAAVPEALEPLCPPRLATLELDGCVVRKVGTVCGAAEEQQPPVRKVGRKEYPVRRAAQVAPGDEVVVVDDRQVRGDPLALRWALAAAAAKAPTVRLILRVASAPVGVKAEQQLSGPNDKDFLYCTFDSFSPLEAPAAAASAPAAAPAPALVASAVATAASAAPVATAAAPAAAGAGAAAEAGLSPGELAVQQWVQSSGGDRSSVDVFAVSTSNMPEFAGLGGNHGEVEMEDTAGEATPEPGSGGGGGGGGSSNVDPRAPANPLSLPIPPPLPMPPPLPTPLPLPPPPPPPLDKNELMFPTVEDLVEEVAAETRMHPTPTPTPAPDQLQMRESGGIYGPEW